MRKKGNAKNDANVAAAVVMKFSLKMLLKRPSVKQNGISGMLSKTTIQNAIIN